MSLPLPYMERTRAYYLALGYDNPYQWAAHDDVPFAPLLMPLNKARVAIVTTAAPFKPGAGDQGPHAPYNAAAKFYDVYKAPVDPLPDLRVSHVAIDRAHTSAEDTDTYLPITALRRASARGVVGAMAEAVVGLPTNRSQRTTREVDAPKVEALLASLAVDAAILVPNCPVCHQSTALVARHLEANGLPTVVMGCAKDIVEQAGVARFVFSDFPLGNSAGKPHDRESQDITMTLALDLLAEATAPRTTVTSPLQWSGDDRWKEDYANPEQLTAEDLARKKAEFDAAKSTAKTLRAPS
ncbi:MAG: glycine reductase [Alphaproteobacteria bacterium]|nr:glycine reductase [Alphaproteobacteria bacterium]